MASISQIENGKQTPSMRMLEALVAALGLTTERFYGRVPEPKKAA